MPISAWTYPYDPTLAPAPVVRTVTLPMTQGTTSPPTTGQLWPRTKASG
jgi:hypothetical protein